MSGYKLVLHSITCNSSADSFLEGSDHSEIYITNKNNDTRIWGVEKVKTGTNKPINKTIEFSTSIKIEIWDEDFNPNDLVGDYTFRKTTINNGSLNFKRSGDFTLYYSIKPPPPPKLQFNPKLSFQLSQVELKNEYYLTSPKKVDFLSFDFKCLGVSNSLKNLSVDFTATNKVTINRNLGSKTVSFPDLINPLNRSANKNINLIQLNIREHYAWYLPTALTSFQSIPILEARSIDKGKSFDKYQEVSGPGRQDTIQFNVSLGYQYVLFFKVGVSYNQTLVSNEPTNVIDYTKAVKYYLAEISKYLKGPTENLSIGIEIENINAKPKMVTGKSITVVKEEQKGRNLTFKDADGYVMEREEFVSAIKQGLYPGYHIRKIKGIETPVSDPDSTSKNNLG